MAHLAGDVEPERVLLLGGLRRRQEPYFSVPSTGIEDLNDPIRKWPFNDPDYNLFAVLNLAVGGSGGGDPASGSYPPRCSSTGSVFLTSERGLSSVVPGALCTSTATSGGCRRLPAPCPCLRL